MCVWVCVCQHYLYQCSGHLPCIIVGLIIYSYMLYLYQKSKKERQRKRDKGRKTEIEHISSVFL